MIEGKKIGKHPLVKFARNFRQSKERTDMRSKSHEVAARVIEKRAAPDVVARERQG